MSHAYQISVWKPQGKKSFGDVGKTDSEKEWNEWLQLSAQTQTTVNMVTNLQIHKSKNFLTKSSIEFQRKILHKEVN
jgi:hypothetical protein